MCRLPSANPAGASRLQALRHWHGTLASCPYEIKDSSHTCADNRVNRGGSRVSPGKGNAPIAQGDCGTHESSKGGDSQPGGSQSTACGCRATPSGGCRTPESESRDRAIA